MMNINKLIMLRPFQEHMILKYSLPENMGRDQRMHIGISGMIKFRKRKWISGGR